MKISNNASRLPLHMIAPVLLVLVMTVLDGSIVNVALPVMAGELGVDDSATVWLVTIYQLLITMLLLPASGAGEKYGYSKVFLWGSAVFTLSSLLCALSPDFSVLLVARAIQGVGAALVMGVNIALTRIIYPKEVLGRGLALNAMVIAISTATGPTIAGALLSIASWHWLFLINLPIGIIAYILGRKRLPPNPSINNRDEEKDKKGAGGYDWRSALGNMGFFGLTFLALGLFSKNDSYGINSLLLVAGLIVGYFYIRRQLRIKRPILPIDLFRRRLFSQSIMTSVSSFIAQNISLIALPFLYHSRYGFSEVMTGLLITPWPIATMIISPLAARFVEKHNPGRTAACGMACYAAGVLLLLLLPSSGVDPWNIAWRMALCGVGFGMFQTPNNIVMVMATPMHRSGSAGGMQGTARLMGQTLGATIVAAIFALAPEVTAISYALTTALAFAVLAGTFSLSRKIPTRE